MLEGERGCVDRVLEGMLIGVRGCVDWVGE